MGKTKTTKPRAEADKYIVRFPPGMRKRIEEAAKSEGRSMNLEIVTRLQATLERPTAIRNWAFPTLVDEIEKRAADSGVEFESMLNSVLAAGLREDAAQVLYISLAPGSTAAEIRAALDATKDQVPERAPIFITHKIDV